MTGESVQLPHEFGKKEKRKKQKKRPNISSFRRRGADHFSKSKVMNAEETKTSEPTPEQLLKMLDLQLDSIRSKRSGGDTRAGIRIASIVVVLAVAAGALFFLMKLLDNYRSERTQHRHSSQENAEQ